MEDAKMEKCLSLLGTIKNYKVNLEHDKDFLSELEEDFPEVNIVEMVKSWKTWLLDNPLKPKRKGSRKGGSNPHLSLRHHIQLQIKWGKEAEERHKLFLAKWKKEREEKDRILREAEKMDREQKQREIEAEHRKKEEDYNPERNEEMVGKILKGLGGKNEPKK